MPKYSSDKSVAFIVPDIYPCSTGGMEIFYNTLLKELKKKTSIILITACSKYKENGLEIIRIKKKFIYIPTSGRLFVPIRVFLALFKHRKKIKIAHFPYTSIGGKWGYILPLLNKMIGLKYLLHLHGGGMGKWKYLDGNKTLFDRASELIAVSEIIKAEYEKRTRRNIEVVYPLVPFTYTTLSKVEIRKSKGFSNQDKILIFAGSLKTIKGPGTLLKAFALIDREQILKHRLKLIFVGKGNLKEELENQALNYGLKDHVTFTGLIPYEEIPVYFKMADIYVIPSHFEGTPKSLLEAMFNKMPIIASDVLGINNILTDNVNALLFPADDSEALKNRILQLTDDEQLCQRISVTAFEHYSRKYSFEKTMNSLISYYNKYE